MTEARSVHFRRHRFPAEIIAHAVWLYYRFPLSFRDVEDLLAERGISVSFQTVSEWAAKFGLKFAHQLRRRSRGHFADKWQLDEMVVTIKGKKYWLWRAVDANGYVLDALLQSRRNKAAALRLMRKLLKDQGATSRVMVTDKLRSYSAAKVELMPTDSQLPRRLKPLRRAQPRQNMSTVIVLHSDLDHRRLTGSSTAWIAAGRFSLSNKRVSGHLYATS